MKVIPNSAMMTVTTADSKYSRMTVFGGPTTSGSTFTSRSRPFDLTERAVNVSVFSGDSLSKVVAGSLIQLHRRLAGSLGQAAVKQPPHRVPSVSGQPAQP